MPFGPLLVSAITKLIEMVVCEQSRYCFNIQSPMVGRIFARPKAKAMMQVRCDHVS
jgi:hypothetical protein